MPSKERSKSAPPSRSREKIAGQGRNEEDEPRSGNRSSDFEDEDVFEESGGGFKWSDLRISLYRKNTIDNMKKRIIELQEENQGLRNEIERYKAAMNKLEETLKVSSFISHVHFGNVQYGTGDMYVVDQAKDTIEELSKMLTEVLSNIAELKQKGDRNEVLLKENMDAIKSCISDMKNLTPQSKSKLQKEIADLTASHSDEQVYFEGIRALKDVEQHGRLLTDFDNIPKKSRRAIQRLVKVYGTQLGAKRFADLLGIGSVVTLQKVINGEDTDQNRQLDVERCTVLVIEWTKNIDNTPKKFLEIMQNIDKLLIQEKANQLVAEKTEALTKKLSRKKHDDSVSNTSDGSTPQSIGSQHTGKTGDHQLLRDQMAHITELCEYVLGLHEKVDASMQMTAETKSMQEETIAILKKAI